MPAPAPLMTLREVMTWLNVTERHVRGLVARDAIPVLRVGVSLRFDQRALESWMQGSGTYVPDESGEVGSQPGPRKRRLRTVTPDRDAARALWSTK